MSSSWCSVHIYYHTDQDALLLECIKPLLSCMTETAIASKLFYLRHWQGGPHLRLRFFSSEETAAREIVKTRLQQFLLSRPSRCSIDEQSYAAMRLHFGALEKETFAVELQPDNSYRFERYHPEYAKFGGERGVAIAEELFERSTTISLVALSTITGSHDRRLGVAFIMLLTAACCFGIPRQELGSFIGAYERAWSQYVPSAAMAKWQSLFDEKRRVIRATADRILDGEVSPNARPWADTVTAAARTLDQAGSSVYDAMGVAAPDEQKRQLLLMQYVHTHNNRLGVNAADEAYLGFLARSCLEASS
jgi:thiopeptide-type bacteriocin biosynthesis protein